VARDNGQGRISGPDDVYAASTAVGGISATRHQVLFRSVWAAVDGVVVEHSRVPWIATGSQTWPWSRRPQTVAKIVR
jgi:hypothetical protein